MGTSGSPAGGAQRDGLELGLGLDVYRGARLDLPVGRVLLAERLGFHSVWTAEAYGADALSPLAYLAALTTRIRLGTAVVQLAARTPAATAMHAMTIDALAGGGRVIIGLGVSGPQIVEGWYGQPWGRPTDRLRDYVAIMRKVIARAEPLTHDGPELQLPYRGPGAVGQGKALRSILHPTEGIEVWIAAGGPGNVALAAEIADGWLPMGYGPEGSTIHAEPLARGFARRGVRPPTFQVFTGITVQLTDDVRAFVDAAKPLIGMYVGGMGSASHNYHREAMARRGFPEAAARIHELWMAGRRDEAVAAVPDEYVEQTSLVGTEARIRDRWRAVEGWGATGVIVRTSQDEALELVADLAGARDRAGVAGDAS